MATDNQTTIAGNLVEGPELRFTNTGTPVTNLRVAVTQRIQQDGEWRDGDTSFFNVNVWRGQAEHLADFTKGDRVMVTGRLRQRTWETPEGEKRSVAEIEADEVGASLKFATAKVERASERSPSDRSQGRERQAERSGDVNDQPPSDQPSFRRPRPWLGALTFRAVTAMAARYAILPSPGRQRRANRLNSGACTCRYGCVSQDGGAAIPRPSPNPRPSDSDGDGCSASAWMAPDGSSLLTLDGALRPDGSRRIRKDRLDDHRDDQGASDRTSDALRGGESMRS